MKEYPLQGAAVPMLTHSLLPHGTPVPTTLAQADGMGDPTHYARVTSSSHEAHSPNRLRNERGTNMTLLLLNWQLADFMLPLYHFVAQVPLRGTGTTSWHRYHFVAQALSTRLGAWVKVPRS
jgi:hypothetical protein